MSTTKPLTPEVYWAQRTNLVYLTIDLQDTVEPKIALTEKGLDFSAVSDKKNWAFSLEFFGAVDVEASTPLTKITARNIFLTLKKTQDKWWDRLNKGSKLNFVKTDFARWKDEDDEDEEEDTGMGGMGDEMGGMGGMPGMGGMGGMGGNFDIQQMMASMGGMGGMGGPPGAYDSDDDDLPDGDEDDAKDDDVPALETAPEDP